MLKRIRSFFRLQKAETGKPVLAQATSPATERGARPAAPVRPRSVDAAEERLYRKLLARTLGDRAKAQRLIEYERRRLPRASRQVLIATALERWDRDSR